MNKSELIEKITSKKEFSQLPKEDIERAFEKFENKNLNDYQKFKMTRQFLRKIFLGFSSRKVFSSSGKEIEWYLMKHKSSKERFLNYGEIYCTCLKGFTDVSVIDLGAGINGLSYEFFSSGGFKVNYIAIEAIGQFVQLMNDFFEKKKFSAKAYHLSLFDLQKVKEIIKRQKTPRVIFLFKVIDSLELVKRDYSKELLKEISQVSDRIIVSFATRSLGSRTKFSVQRGWLIKFIKENFEILDDFEINGERYLSFKNKKS
jgi:hypothetical protein